MKLPKIVSNKYMLYIVLVLAIINAVSLLNERDYDSLLLLSIVGLLSSYFTKNMADSLSNLLLSFNNLSID